MGWRLTLVACGICVACSPTPSAHPAPPTPHEEQTTRLYFVSDIVMPLPDPDTMAYAQDPGLDLDGIVSDDTTRTACGIVPDVTDPSHPTRRGIDAELGWSLVFAVPALGCLSCQAPLPTPLGEELIAEGALALAFRITESDDAVTITWGRARPASCGDACAPELDSDGTARAGQAMTFTPFSATTPLARVADGRLGASIDSFDVPFAALVGTDSAPGASPFAAVRIARAAFETTEIDGTSVHGTIGGTVTDHDIALALAAGHPFDAYEYEMLIEQVTLGDFDPSPDGSHCTSLSVGLDYTAVLVTEVAE